MGGGFDHFNFAIPQGGSLKLYSAFDRVDH